MNTQVPVSPATQTGGGSPVKDSACGLESAIASSRGVDRPQVLSSLRDSQSPDSTSTILESKSVDKKHAQAQKSNREPLAQASTQSLDSSIDCHALKSARNDGKNLDSISIIIPCFNEKSTITDILQVVQSVQIPYHKEIIIVDDCSTDGTREILATLAQDSASGSHSGDFVDFEATADHQSSSAPKSTKSPTSNTAIPRILEKDNQGKYDKPYREQTSLEKVDSRNFDNKAQNLTPKLESSISLKIIYHDKNQGKGAALRTGITHASGDLVLIQDADLEYDPNEYPKLLAPFEKGVADVVFGSRFVSGESHRVLYFWHRMGNGLLTLLSNMMTNLNLTDMETCYKVFKREIIQSITIEENRFGFEPEITAKIAKIKGIRIYEVGISYYGRTYEEGKKIGVKDGFRALWAIVKYRFKG